MFAFVLVQRLCTYVLFMFFFIPEEILVFMTSLHIAYGKISLYIRLYLGLVTQILLFFVKFCNLYPLKVMQKVGQY